MIKQFDRIDKDTQSQWKQDVKTKGQDEEREYPGLMLCNRYSHNPTESKGISWAEGNAKVLGRED